MVTAQFPDGGLTLCGWFVLPANTPALRAYAGSRFRLAKRLRPRQGLSGVSFAAVKSSAAYWAPLYIDHPAVLVGVAGDSPVGNADNMDNS